MQHNNPEPASPAERPAPTRKPARKDPAHETSPAETLPGVPTLLHGTAQCSRKIREKLRFHPFFYQSTAQARRVNTAGIDPYKQRRMASHPPQKRFRIFFGILILPKFNQRPGNRIGQRKPTSPVLSRLRQTNFTASPQKRTQHTVDKTGSAPFSHFLCQLDRFIYCSRFRHAIHVDDLINRQPQQLTDQRVHFTKRQRRILRNDIIQRQLFFQHAVKKRTGKSPVTG